MKSFAVLHMEKLVGRVPECVALKKQSITTKKTVCPRCVSKLTMKSIAISRRLVEGVLVEDGLVEVCIHI